MIPTETLSAFFVLSVVLGLAPGPDNIFVLTQSALYGWRAGIAVTLGLCTGLLVHTLAVAVGVAAIFQTSAFAFTLIKTAGAAYLLYLAWQAFNARPSTLPDSGEQANELRRLYFRGIVMNISNPKIAIFFLAFLPQFADPARGSVPLQIIAFGAVFVIATILVFSLVTWASGSLGRWLRQSPGAQRLINRLAGIVFVGLALKLTITTR